MQWITEINLGSLSGLPDLLNKFERFYRLRFTDSAKIKIIIPLKVYPEYLIALVGIIKYIRSKGVIVDIEIENLSNNNYPQRMNFHKELGIYQPETFQRRDSTGRFVEITPLNRDNNVDVTNDIMQVIRNNCAVDRNVVSCLNYCFFEMVDNIENHALSPIGGYTVVQNFPYRKELKLVILDAGRGIYESLTENEIYRGLTPPEALEYSIKDHVTNGHGEGVGLFHTSQFIRENKGHLTIHSGNYCLEVSQGRERVFKCAYWQGTFICVTIKTNSTVCFETIFGNNIPDSVMDSDTYIDRLW